jgi:hypothetical protein
VLTRRSFRIVVAIAIFAAGAVVAFATGGGAGATDGYYSTTIETTVSSDTTPPSITCSASPASLWPPNHKLRNVTATVNVTDSSTPTRFELLSVTSSQPDSGLGKDDVRGDVQGWTVGTNDISGQLRAERYGAPRVYTLTYRGYDAAGNYADCSTTVTVAMS